MACYYIVISSTHLRDGQLRNIKGVFRGPIGAGGHQRNNTEEGTSSLYCELCDKQYVRHQQFDNHINSYDHHHKQRLKELKHREFYRALACRRQRRRREERSLRKTLRQQQQHGRHRHEYKAEEHCAPGCGPMFRSTTVAVEPASAMEKWSDSHVHNGDDALASAPQSSLLLPVDATLRSRLLSDTRWPYQRGNAHAITPGNITSTNGHTSRGGAFNKLPWAPGFLSDTIRANNIPADSENKGYVASRGRPVCFSLPKRSCLLLHQSAAVFIQAGRNSRDGIETTQQVDNKVARKQISTTRLTGELDDKTKATLSLCNHRHRNRRQVHVGGGRGAQNTAGSRTEDGTRAQDGGASGLRAQICGGECETEAVQVNDGEATGAQVTGQRATGDRVNVGGGIRAQTSGPSTIGGTGTRAEDGAASRTGSDGGPGAGARGQGCSQTLATTEASQNRTGVQLISVMGAQNSEGGTTSAKKTGWSGTEAAVTHGLGTGAILNGGGLKTGAQVAYQRGTVVQIIPRCSNAPQEQDGSQVIVARDTGAEDPGDNHIETGARDGGARRAGTTQDCGDGWIGILKTGQSGTGTQSAHGSGIAAEDHVTRALPPLLESQSPAFETSDKTYFVGKLHSSTLAEPQQAALENQAKDPSLKQSPRSPPGRPKEPFCPVLSRQGSRVLLWPSEMVRYTKTSPSLSYSVNPLLYDFRAHAGGNGEAGRPSVIKHAGRRQKPESGGGGGQAESDQSPDENGGGQAGNPLQMVRQGKGGLRRRRKKRGGLRKRGRRKRREEMKRKEQSKRKIMIGLHEMARDDSGTEKSQKKRLLSHPAVRRTLEGPAKSPRGRREQWLTENHVLLCSLSANRCNRKRVNAAGAGPHRCQQSSSGWGPALTKLLCGGAACNAAISPAIQTPRCPAITAHPAGMDTGPEHKHGDGDERGPQDKGRGNPREIKAQEARVCAATISSVLSPRRDAAGRRQIHLAPSSDAQAACDAAISPIPLSFGGPACAHQQTAAPSICTFEAQKTERQPSVPSACANATLAGKDLAQEMRGGDKRKCTECPQTCAGKKHKGEPNQTKRVIGFGLGTTLDSTSEASSKEMNPSHFSPDRTAHVYQDANANGVQSVDDKVVDTPPEDAAHDDVIKRQLSSQETNPRHLSPERLRVRVCQESQSFSSTCVAPYGYHLCRDSVNAQVIDAPLSEPKAAPSKDGQRGEDKAKDEHGGSRCREVWMADPVPPDKSPRFPLGLPPGCLRLQAPVFLPPSASSFSFHRTVIQHHVSLLPPPLPLPSYLLPALAPQPLGLNPPPPPSFLASPAIHLLDAPYPLVTDFHPMLSQHHPALLAPPHPAALPLQLLF
ncbi:uncharacterized protein [Syngnathus scovelli]|uniref:uncharacterized protein n=1 Tax=Syngnathus scovelli TaxID=161590 RepID=UPI0021103FEF|nr:uncharacterized protein LOC125978089 [Syngnathus scovelli]XP_049591070.1 uncharacterized protein LOC125978089 [Syngnathus scovelli]